MSLLLLTLQRSHLGIHLKYTKNQFFRVKSEMEKLVLENIGDFNDGKSKKKSGFVLYATKYIRKSVLKFPIELSTIKKKTISL